VEIALVDAGEERRESFTRFFSEAEPRLRHAFIARYGLDVGREVTADALTYGWEHWERVRAMDNSIGYLYRVGRTSFRRYRRKPTGTGLPSHREPWFEPALPGALAQLSERQRVTVVLKHSFKWTFAEIADLLGISIPSAQKHERRALAKLRKELGVEIHA